MVSFKTGAKEKRRGPFFLSRILKNLKRTPSLFLCASLICGPPVTTYPDSTICPFSVLFHQSSHHEEAVSVTRSIEYTVDIPSIAVNIYSQYQSVFNALSIGYILVTAVSRLCINKRGKQLLMTTLILLWILFLRVRVHTPPAKDSKEIVALVYYTSA